MSIDKYISNSRRTKLSGRDDTIRTCDLLVPNQAFYQLNYIPVTTFLSRQYESCKTYPSLRSWLCVPLARIWLLKVDGLTRNYDTVAIGNIVTSQGFEPQCNRALLLHPGENKRRSQIATAISVPCSRPKAQECATVTQKTSLYLYFSRTVSIASLKPAFGSAPTDIFGSSFIGQNRMLGILRIPKAAAKSPSASVSTL